MEMTPQIALERAHHLVESSGMSIKAGADRDFLKTEIARKFACLPSIGMANAAISRCTSASSWLTLAEVTQAIHATLPAAGRPEARTALPPPVTIHENRPRWAVQAGYDRAKFYAENDGGQGKGAKYWRTRMDYWAEKGAVA